MLASCNAGWHCAGKSQAQTRVPLYPTLPCSWHLSQRPPPASSACATDCRTQQPPQLPPQPQPPPPHMSPSPSGPPSLARTPLAAHHLHPPPGLHIAQAGAGHCRRRRRAPPSSAAAARAPGGKVGCAGCEQGRRGVEGLEAEGLGGGVDCCDVAAAEEPSLGSSRLHLPWSCRCERAMSAAVTWLQLRAYQSRAGEGRAAAHGNAELPLPAPLLSP